MQNHVIKLLAVTLTTIAVPALAKPLSLHTVGKSPVTYQCNDGTQIIANYYELSDKSLQFVKLKLKSQQLTLPQGLSASGARYSDGYQFQWWIKGNNATFIKDISDQNQKPIECKVIY